MAILNKGQTFSDGEQVTSAKLNTAVDGATFASGAVDDVSTQLSGGAIIVKDGGVGTAKIADSNVTTAKIADDAVTPEKLSTGSPTWSDGGILEYVGSATAGGLGNTSLTLAASENSGIDAKLALGVKTGNTPFIGTIAGTGSAANPSLIFYTSTVERARIDGNGTLLIGTTDTIPYDNTGSNSGIALHGNGSSRAGLITCARVNGQPLLLNRLSSNGDIVSFFREGTAVGTISVTTSSTAYNTSSDYRLKEDVIEMEGSLDRLKALKPCNFRWKSDGTRVDGFLAHEAQEIVPEAVTGNKDAVDDEGNPDYQGIDQSKLVPLLTKALQEAVAKIESLEERVAALES
jgi:hypothetical protein